jgi:simple sugar transport system ATP-binding protein
MEVAISEKPSTEFAVELEDITKTFPGVIANSDINLAVRVGEIHALVGENGAGKSTLMKTLYGMHQPDSGRIKVNGREVTFHTPGDAIAAGVGMVHQHFMLADNLTVLENVVLGSEPRKGIRLDRKSARKRILEVSEQYGLDLDPDQLVEDLGVGMRQRVEIMKVLFRGAKILILDEPTAVLVPQEVDELFASLRVLVAEGNTILFISHKLDEVLQVADQITVIRRGTTVATVDPAEVTSRELAELMVGSELPVPELRDSTVTDREVLQVSGLTLTAENGRALLSDLNVTIHAGEVVGIAGVEGNGQSELVDVLMGIRRPSAGKVSLGDADITSMSTRHRREQGVALIPEDRARQGLLLEASLWENRMLGHQTVGPAGGELLISPAAAKEEAERIVADYDVRTPGVGVLASSLSGGNQQKFIVGREMSGEPMLLIAAHPTRGVDVGAQSAIWDQLREARAKGLAVLLISADLDELIGMSDTIKVILRGRFVADADPRTVTPEELGSAMTGAGEAA